MTRYSKFERGGTRPMPANFSPIFIWATFAFFVYAGIHALLSHDSDVWFKDADVWIAFVQAALVLVIAVAYTGHYRKSRQGQKSR